MAFYESLFSKKGLFCSQVLLLDDDFREKKSHIRDTLLDLMESGVIPIINENDVMSLRKTPLT
jgi:glutamate 5-kinase